VIKKSETILENFVRLSQEKVANNVVETLVGCTGNSKNKNSVVEV
jgi:hypothetical protein